MPNQEPEKTIRTILASVAGMVIGAFVIWGAAQLFDIIRWKDLTQAWIDRGDRFTREEGHDMDKRLQHIEDWRNDHMIAQHGRLSMAESMAEESETEGGDRP